MHLFAFLYILLPMFSIKKLVAICLFFIGFFAISEQQTSYSEVLEKFVVEEEAGKKDINLNLPKSTTSQKEENNLKSFWKTEFKAKTFADRSTTDNVVSTEIYGKLDWNLLDSVSFHTQGLIIGRSGFTQSIYDRSDRKNGLYLLEGYFDVRPLSFVSIKFGNYKQDFLESPLLITDRTFPSILETVYLTTNENFKTSLIFQQSIPNNAPEVLRRESQIIRGAPYFLTNSVLLEAKPFGSLFSIKDRFTFFLFDNLPPSLAEAGRTRGNSVDYLRHDSQFKYNFVGIYNSFNIQMPLSSVSVLELGGDFLHNLTAPNTFNQGERYYGSFYYNFNNFVEVKLTGEYFANQSDSSVAYYNDEIYGHNNRVGGLIKLQTHFYNSGITVGLTYVHSQPINEERSAIRTSNAILFSLGTKYISI